MRKKKVRTNYGKLNFDELHTMAGRVRDCLKDSTIFVNMPVSVEDLENLANDFQTKWEVAKDGSKLDKTLRDEAKTALLEAFSQLANYVNHTAKGQMSVLVSSGFDPESEPKPTRITGAPVLLTVEDGPQKNQLEFKFRGSNKRLLYEYQYADSLDQDGEPAWGELLQTTKCTNNIIAPTKPGVVYYVRVRIKNGAGPSDWSQVVSLMAR